jgi:RNA polymerase sigma-70 factor (ECF subfamily)
MASEGDAFRAGLGELLPQLRAFARFLARDPALADDLVQECLLRALRAEAQWAPDSSLRAWCFRILRNVFLELRRRGRGEARAMAGYRPDASVAGAQEAHAELAALAGALDGLPMAQREALILVGAHALSYAEAASVIGVAEGTVKARVSRARRALADSLRPGGTAAGGKDGNAHPVER